MPFFSGVKPVIENGRITGIIANDEEHRADIVVLATSLAPAQRLLKPFAEMNSWFAPMMALKTMPSVTIQLELWFT